LSGRSALASPRAPRDGRVLEYGDYEPESLPGRIGEHGWLLIRGMPCWIGNAALLDLAASVGRIKRHGPNLGDPTREGEAVGIIRSFAQPIADRSGTTMLSTMATDHHLHTDESFYATPSRYVLLHCWRPDPAGDGISLIATAEDALARLTAEERRNCARFRYSWRGVESPILAAMPGNAPPRLRFNIREADCLEKPRAAGDALAQRFARAADEAALELPLAEGDCLVLDNWRVLHGRTAFAPDSPRLLKRVGVETN
jgi:alpha-ketoglutarate-dependent taurine dioxygenase